VSGVQLGTAVGHVGVVIRAEGGGIVMRAWVASGPAPQWGMWAS
jgi:hypothetical protein